MNAQDIVELLYAKGVVLSVSGDNLIVELPDETVGDYLLDMVKENKTSIISLLKELDGSKVVVPLIKREYPLSYECMTSAAQQRILFMEELSGNSSYYNIPVAYRIIGNLNKDALQKSLNSLVARHDILRSKYIVKHNTYVQYICEPAQIDLTEISLVGNNSQETILISILQGEAEYTFSLSNEWPIKALLIELKENECVLSINIHHIAADGWSAKTITNEISAAYRFFCHHPYEYTYSENDRDYQYADYVWWLTEWKKTDEYLRSRDYWFTELNAAPELHSLPTDYVRPTVQSVVGDTYSQLLSTSLSDSINACAQLNKTTPFVIFQALFAAFLARYSGESDIIFGTVTANRKPIEFINTVGLFVNTLVLRFRIDNNATVHDIIQQALAVTERAFEFQQFSFDSLVDELQPTRSLGYNPLVQVLLVMQDNAAGSLKLDELDVTSIKQRQNVSKFDLALHVSLINNQFLIEWEYSTKLFKGSTISRMADHFDLILDNCISFPESKIYQLSLLRNNNQFTQLSANELPEPQCISQLFEHQVALNKERIALREGDRAISYGELNEYVNNAANYLYEACQSKVGRVGVCSEKSIELIVALLASFKIGATYVPFDPHYPKERLEWMAIDSKINILLLGEDTNFSADAQIKVVNLASLTNIGAPSNGAAFVINTDTPAYIIYTSGSTGKPKGVLVSQKSLFYSLQANRSVMGITSTDILPTIGSQAFGVSLLEILLPLVCGGEVQIIRKAQVVDLDQLIKATNMVTVLHAVPSLMRQWLDAVIEEKVNVYPNLRLLLVGGEPVPDELLKRIKRWRPQVQLLELYGMTESTVVCSSYAVGNDLHPNYCIGKPHKTTSFYVLNEQRMLQPVGVPGELYIGGFCLANGYINQPEMTAEKFIDNPFVDGEKLYRTGDRVRLLDDGCYEFLGRVDHQVSLRGVRIELGEIESLAMHISGVKQAIAHVVCLNECDQTLVLFFTAYSNFSNSNELPEKIRAYLSVHLPGYMRPTIIQLLESFPLNPNGKVDRKRLPMPEIDNSLVEPATPIEEALVQMWQVVLGGKDVGVAANFFEVGGHSLMASKLSSLIRKQFSIEFPLAALFEFPTIQSCGKYIEHVLKEKYAEDLLRRDATSESSEDELII